MNLAEKNLVLIDKAVNEPQNYSIKDLSILATLPERVAFDRAAELLKAVAVIDRLNKQLETADAEKRIDSSILMKVAHSLITGADLNKEEIFQYFEMHKVIEDVSNAYDLSFVLPLDVDYHLAGWSFTDQTEKPLSDGEVSTIDHEYLNAYNSSMSGSELYEKCREVLAFYVFGFMLD